MDSLSYILGEGEKRKIRNIKFGVGFKKIDEIHKTVS